MNILSKYKVVIAVVLPILILVLMRSLGTNHFKSNAEKWASPSVTRTNIISMDQAGNLRGRKLVVNLESEVSSINLEGMGLLNVPADSILNKSVLRTISNHDGPLLLYASEDALTVKIWMVLSQLGYNNIYILTSDPANEVNKNKFRPDSTIRPEL